MRLRAFNCDRLYGVRLVEALTEGGALSAFSLGP